MGATLDQFDTIDFSDNDIRKLENFPFLPRLKNLLLNNNRIVRIGDDIADTLPHLESIILSGNNVQEFCDLEALTKLERLETLSLLTNPVSAKPHYREYMAHKFPHLRLLDFRKIKPKERDAAKAFFKTAKGKEILREIAKRNKLASRDEMGEKPHALAASRVEMMRIKEAIRNAKSLAEVERLTRILQSGQITEEFSNGRHGDEEMDE